MRTSTPMGKGLQNMFTYRRRLFCVLTAVMFYFKSDCIISFSCEHYNILHAIDSNTNIHNREIPHQKLKLVFEKRTKMKIFASLGCILPFPFVPFLILSATSLFFFCLRPFVKGSYPFSKAFLREHIGIFLQPPC